MIIKISSRFEKSYKNLSSKIKEKAKNKEAVFRNNPFDPQLKTHKLKGKQRDFWAFWINDSYRVKFIFINSDEVLFLNIGTHDIYK